MWETTKSCPTSWETSCAASCRMPNYVSHYTSAVPYNTTTRDNDSMATLLTVWKITKSTSLHKLTVKLKKKGKHLFSGTTDSFTWHTEPCFLIMSKVSFPVYSGGSSTRWRHKISHKDDTVAGYKSQTFKGRLIFSFHWAVLIDKKPVGIRVVSVTGPFCYGCLLYTCTQEPRHWSFVYIPFIFTLTDGRPLCGFSSPFHNFTRLLCSTCYSPPGTRFAFSPNGDNSFPALSSSQFRRSSSSSSSSTRIIKRQNVIKPRGGAVFRNVINTRHVIIVVNTTWQMGVGRYTYYI